MSTLERYLENKQFWLLALVAGFAFLLTLFNIVQSKKNRSIQDEIDSRQLYIKQTVRISRLNTQMVQSLANLAAKTGDKQISNLLANHGISFNTNLPKSETVISSEDVKPTKKSKKSQ